MTKENVKHPAHYMTKENVKHPAHYGGENNPYETIKVVEAWDLGFCLGNVLKYISRAGKKGEELEDLKKAAWYLNREIERRSRQTAEKAEPKSKATFMGTPHSELLEAARKGCLKGIKDPSGTPYVCLCRKCYGW